MSEEKHSPKSVDPFYINISLLNKSDVIAQQVGKKTGLKATGFLGRAAAFTANKLVTDEKIIATLSHTLIEKVRSAVQEMGINAELKGSFQKGAFCVIRVQIRSIDKLQLLTAAKGPDFAASFSTLLSSISSLGLAETVLPTIDEKILIQVQQGMMTKFEEVIPSKMKAEGLEVDCCVLSSENQAEYFFSFLEALQSSEHL